MPSCRRRRRKSDTAGSPLKNWTPPQTNCSTCPMRDWWIPKFILSLLLISLTLNLNYHHQTRFTGDSCGVGTWLFMKLTGSTFLFFIFLEEFICGDYPGTDLLWDYWRIPKFLNVFCKMGKYSLSSLTSPCSFAGASSITNTYFFFIFSSCFSNRVHNYSVTILSSILRLQRFDMVLLRT